MRRAGGVALGGAWTGDAWTGGAMAGGTGGLTPSCPAGYTLCGNACIDLMSNPLNCGICGLSALLRGSEDFDEEDHTWRSISALLFLHRNPSAATAERWLLSQCLADSTTNTGSKRSEPRDLNRGRRDRTESSVAGLTREGEIWTRAFDDREVAFSGDCFHSWHGPVAFPGHLGVG